MKTIKNMTADELRKSILQLAIQGKLVKQNPNDEPASVLVDKIYEEKKKLIAEGKIKKEKEESRIFKGDDNRYYEKIGKNEPVDITDDLPFDIPDSWEWIRINSVFNIINGFTPLRSNEKFWKDGTIPWFTVEDIHRQGKYIENTKVKINSCACSQDRITPRNSFLLCCTASIGEFALTKIPLTTNQQFNALSLKDYSQNIYNMGFILAIGGYFKNLLMSIAGTTTFPFVSTKKLGRILLPLPPLEEQKRIVEKIEELEPYIKKYDDLEKQLTKLENEITDKLKKSILQYAIQGKLVKQDPNDEPASVLLERIKAEKEKLIKEGKIKRDKNESFIYQGDDKNYYEKNSQKIRILNDYVFDLPQNWEWCSLSNLSKLITDGTHKTPNYVSQGIPFLSVQNISSGKFDLSKLKYISEDEHLMLTKRCNPNSNDILICRIGTLGKPIINTLDFDFSIFVSLGLIKLINSQLANYIKFILDSPFTYNFIDYVKVGGGTHTFKINIEDINRFPIPLAPLNEQNRILNRIHILFDTIK